MPWTFAEAFPPDRFPEVDAYAEELKRVGETGEAYITDRTGRIVAHKNHSLVLKGSSIGPKADYCHIEKGFSGGYVLRACEPVRL